MLRKTPVRPPVDAPEQVPLQEENSRPPKHLVYNLTAGYGGGGGASADLGVMPESHGLERRQVQVRVYLNKDMDTMFGYVFPFSRSPGMVDGALGETDVFSVSAQVLPGMDFQYHCFWPPQNPGTFEVMSQKTPDAITEPDPRHYNEAVRALTAELEAGTFAGPIIFTGNGDPRGEYVPTGLEIDRLIAAAKKGGVPIYFIYLDDPVLDETFAEGLTGRWNELNKKLPSLNPDSFDWPDVNNEMKSIIHTKLRNTERFTGGKCDLSGSGPVSASPLYSGTRTVPMADGNLIEEPVVRNAWPANHNHRIYKYKRMCEETGGQLVRIFVATPPIGGGLDEDSQGNNDYAHAIPVDSGIAGKIAAASAAIAKDMHEWYSSPNKRGSVMAQKLAPTPSEQTAPEEFHAPAPVAAPATFLEQMLDRFNLGFLKDELAAIPDINSLLDGPFGRAMLAEWGLTRLREEMDKDVMSDHSRETIEQEAAAAFTKFSQVHTDFLAEFDKLDADTLSLQDRVIIAFARSMEKNNISAADRQTQIAGGVDNCHDGIIAGTFDCDLSAFCLAQMGQEAGLKSDIIYCGQGATYDHVVTAFMGPSGGSWSYVEATWLLAGRFSDAKSLPKNPDAVLSQPVYEKKYLLRCAGNVNFWGTHNEVEYIDERAQTLSMSDISSLRARAGNEVRRKVQSGEINGNDENATSRVWASVEDKDYPQLLTRFSTDWKKDPSNLPAYLTYLCFLEKAKDHLSSNYQDAASRYNQLLAQGRAQYKDNLYIFERHVENHDGPVSAVMP